MILVRNEIKQWEETLRKTRRDLHRIPETGYAEFKTREYVKAFLRESEKSIGLFISIILPFSSFSLVIYDQLLGSSKVMLYIEY